jgi:hypothetical protein
VTRSVIGIASLNVNGLGSAALRPFGERAAEFCRWFEESGVEVVNGAPHTVTLRSSWPSSHSCTRCSGAAAAPARLVRNERLYGRNGPSSSPLTAACGCDGVTTT